MNWLRAVWRRLAGRPALPPPSRAPAAPPVPAATTRPAVWADVETVTTALEKHDVAYVLVGGYALYANGLIRNTGDVDIVVRDTPDNNRRWIAALSELPDGAAKEMLGEDHPFPTDAAETDDQPGVIRVFDVFVVDVMPMACGLSYDDLRPHIVRLERGGRGINVLDLEGLLLTKRSPRDKDQLDRQTIELALQRRGDGVPETDRPK